MNLKPVNLSDFRRRRARRGYLPRGARVGVPLIEPGTHAEAADLVVEWHEIRAVMDCKQALSLARRLMEAVAQFEETST